MRAFPVRRPGIPAGYPTLSDAMLASLPGSAWGAFRVEEQGGAVVFVSRHPTSDKRVYVEPDQAHLFDRMPDGELVRRH